jgi:hypothetical protein
LEGPHAPRQRLSPGDALYEALRLSQTTGARDAGLYARAELSALKVGRKVDVPCLWKQEGGGGI